MSIALVFWVLAALSLAIYLYMILGPLRRIREAAGGRAPFDVRPRGYGPEEARAFLSALSNEGRALYLGRQRQLDGAFLVVFTLTLVVAVAWAWGAPWSLIFWPLPMAMGIFDAVENVLVAGLLKKSPADVTDEEVEAASKTTVIKFVLVVASLAAILVGMIL